MEPGRHFVVMIAFNSIEEFVSSMKTSDYPLKKN